MISENPGERIQISETLNDLAARFREKPVSVEEVMGALGPNAAALLCVLITLPFCAPVTIPGTSTPSGLIVAFLAARFALGLAPWLPQRLLRVTLPPRFFGLVFQYAGKLIRWLEKAVRPRWSWVLASPALQRLHAVLIVVCGLLLALPLPPFPPLTNTLPALAIVFGMLGLVERDGRAVLTAWCIFLFTIIYFITAALVGREVWEWLVNWWSNL